jgi:hypothetical protein
MDIWADFGTFPWTLLPAIAKMLLFYALIKDELIFEVKEYGS